MVARVYQCEYFGAASFPIDVIPSSDRSITAILYQLLAESNVEKCGVSFEKLGNGRLRSWRACKSSEQPDRVALVRVVSVKRGFTNAVTAQIKGLPFWALQPLVSRVPSLTVCALDTRFVLVHHIPSAIGRHNHAHLLLSKLGL